MTGKILVLGAGGNVGRPLVETLLAKGEAVKAASRSGRAVGTAEGVRFDYADPASFGPAFDGVDRLFLMLPTGYLTAREMLLPVVEAAAARKVKVVFQSVFGVDASDDIPYRQVELALAASGTPHVVLRPNWFADNFHIFWKAGVAAGRIEVPAADGRTSFVDVRDVAESAAAALTSAEVDGRAFDLTGPEALGYADAAAVLSRVLGRTVAYRPVDDAAFVATLVAAGVPAGYAQFLAAIFHPVREGWTARVTDAVRSLTGHAPRSVETYATDNIARLAT